MGRLIIDKNRQDFLTQLDFLRQAYQNFDNRKNKTPLQIAALAETEEEFVKDGLIPYLKYIIQESTEILRTSISLTMDIQPGKPVKIEVDAKGPQTSTVIPTNTVKPQPAQPVPPPKPVTPPSSFYTVKTATKAPPTGLRITLKNGNVIHENLACDTFTQALAYAIDLLGVQKVVNTILSYNIYLDNEPLVKRGPFKSPQANSHEIGQGYYTNTHSNTRYKKDQLDRIGNILGLGWIVKVI